MVGIGLGPWDLRLGPGIFVLGHFSGGMGHISGGKGHVSGGMGRCPVAWNGVWCRPENLGLVFLVCIYFVLMPLIF